MFSTTISKVTHQEFQDDTTYQLQPGEALLAVVYPNKTLTVYAPDSSTCDGAVVEVTRYGAGAVLIAPTPNSGDIFLDHGEGDPYALDEASSVTARAYGDATIGWRGIGKF